MDKKMHMPARIAQFLAIISIFFSAIALAQSGMNAKSPYLKVIGCYSYSADTTAYSRFIQSQIAHHDPTNFSKHEKETLRRLGHDLRPFTDEDRSEWDKRLRSHMDDAAVFEVEITNAEAGFDVGKFIQPNPAQPESRWQVAWNEKFLTLDGEIPIELERAQKLPRTSQYRVVFVIHFWKPNLPMRYGDAELAVPPRQPLLERLWRLAPYQLPG